MRILLSTPRPLSRMTAWTPVLFGLVILACGGAEEAPPAEATSAVDLPSLGLSFAALPEGFTVAAGGSGEIELTATDPEAGGRMWLELQDPSDYGIDLVKVVTDQSEAYAQMENSEYFGGRKLVVAAAGEAYYVRGRYDQGGERLEETRVFLIHPAENRLVSLHYAYPAGEDSPERIQRLFDWVGELGVLGAGTGEEEASGP